MPTTKSPALYPRHAADRIRTALADTPVVLVNGPRQCGKTTLVRQLLGGDRSYVTLDDASTLDAAIHDPTGFVRGLDRAVIDEVQRAPALLHAIKQSVDNDRRAGRFLLTGSANLMTLPKVTESLAGRMEIVTLLPLAHAEITGKVPTFLETAFASRIVEPGDSPQGDRLLRTVLAGGYPEMLRRNDAGRRAAWARDYLIAIVQRDIREAADIDRLDKMPRLLRILAHHTGQLINFSQLAGQIGLDDKTARKYISTLEQIYIVSRLAPWSHNRLQRLVKTPKLHFLDSGLLAQLLGATTERIALDRKIFGPLLETFVYTELVKQMGWQDFASEIFHYRDKDQDEIDFIIERPTGDLIAIEVKASATVSSADFRGLRKLAAATGDAFKLGIVAYDSDRIVPFGRRLFAAPVACLWST